MPNNLRPFLILLIVSQIHLHPNAFLAAQEKPATASYSNPILAGDYADPTLFREGQDYYLTHSSFEYYPGLLIWHSKDLVNWTPLCHALTTNVGDVWAPEMLKHGNTYYIYFPARGNKNWVITAPSPSGPWSEPALLEVNHIDPGHVVGPDGERFLHFSSGYVAPLSADGLSIAGHAFQTYDAWKIPEEWDVACPCLESPKLFYQHGYYYLTTAQGGTVGPPTAHMVISARSPTPLGPWEYSPHNPIVHTYSKDETWHAKGHGTPFEDADGNWWIIYHGYKNRYYTLGRQSLMEPLVWTEDGWFIVPPASQTDQPIKKAKLAAQLPPPSLSDDFASPELKLQWSFHKDYDPTRVKAGNGQLQLQARGTSPSDSPPMLCIPRDESYELTVQYELQGNATAGLILYYNETMYAGLATDGSNPLGRSGFLKIRNVDHLLTFHYSADGQNWKKIVRSFSTEAYNHTAFGGFVGLRTGLVSIGDGSVTYRNFNYSKIDDTVKIP